MNPVHGLGCCPNEDLVSGVGAFAAGIYEGIHNGEADHPSHYTQAAGRDHVSWEEYFAGLEG